MPRVGTPRVQNRLKPRRPPPAPLQALNARGRSLSDFLPLISSAEQRLLVACREGEPTVFGGTVPEAPTDATHVRAGFLRFLLLGGDALAPVHERGVMLAGAWVEGKLDLSGCRVARNVDLKRCHFSAAIRAQDAQLDGLLTLEGSRLTAGLDGDRLRCDGGVYLRSGFQSQGTVWLGGAQIGGDLACIGGQFDGQQGVALSADGAFVKGDVFLSAGEHGAFQAKGMVRLPGAQIGGDLTCIGGEFDGQQGDALSADRAVVNGSVFLGAGEHGAFQAKGLVRLLGAQIGGNLDCTGGQFDGQQGFALAADRAVVNGGLFAGAGEHGAFQAWGMVRLLGAQIGGNLDCTGGQFDGQQGVALAADGAVAKGNVFLSAGEHGAFQAKGEVRLLGAQIGGDLTCIGGEFDGQQGDALSAGGAVVKGGFFLREQKVPVRCDLSHAEVGVLLDDESAWAKGSVLDGLRYGALGGGASTQGAMRLDWLHKQQDEHLQVDFRPQPWRQLQKVLREMGHTEDAKQVGIALEDKLREIGRVGQSPPLTRKPVAALKRGVAWGVHFGFGKLAGYGFRPMRLMGWMVAVWLVWGALFWFLALPPRSALAPSDPLVFQHPAYAECLPDAQPTPGNWFLCAPLRGEYATLSPFVYSLDILLPLVDLGQEKQWGAFVPTPKAGANAEFWTHWTYGHFARLLVWFETLFGWVCSLLLVAIVSGFARRSEE